MNSAQLNAAFSVTWCGRALIPTATSAFGCVSLSLVQYACLCGNFLW